MELLPSWISKIAKAKKAFVGSLILLLCLLLYKKMPVSFQCMVLLWLCSLPVKIRKQKLAAKHCFLLLSGKSKEIVLQGSILRDGVVEGVPGPLLCGNLSMLLSLLGTPWDIDYDGKILVLEDVAEAPYRVKRMLLQLKLAGKLDKLSGLAFGSFKNCEAKAGPTLEEVLFQVLDEFLPKSNFPVIAQLPVGHEEHNMPLVLGAKSKIESGKLYQLEKAVQGFD